MILEGEEFKKMQCSNLEQTDTMNVASRNVTVEDKYLKPNEVGGVVQVSPDAKNSSGDSFTSAYAAGSTDKSIGVTTESNSKDNMTEDDTEYPTPYFETKFITRQVTKTIQENDAPNRKNVQSNEHIYESVSDPSSEKAGDEIRGFLYEVGNKGETPFVVTKVVRKKSKSTKEARMKSMIKSLLTKHPIFDDYAGSYAAREIFDSDVILLHLRELETDEEEPSYVMWGTDPNLKLNKHYVDEAGIEKANCDCDDCMFADVCDEYRFGSYCVAAVQRYYNENKYFATVKNAYVVFVSHYNRALDFKSFNLHNEQKGMRPTGITKPPHCMMQGSLLFSLLWVQWKIENGPEKDFYDEMRRKKKRKKMEEEAAKEASKKYRYIKHRG